MTSSCPVIMAMISHNIPSNYISYVVLHLCNTIFYLCFLFYEDQLQSITFFWYIFSHELHNSVPLPLSYSFIIYVDYSESLCLGSGWLGIPSLSKSIFVYIQFASFPIFSCDFLLDCYFFGFLNLSLILKLVSL